MAPARFMMLSISEATSSFLVSEELRTKNFAENFPSPKVTRAIFVEASTMPAKSVSMLCTPLTQPTSALMIASWISSGMTVLGISVRSRVRLIDSSTPLYSVRRVSRKSEASSHSPSASASGRVTTAKHSRGIALRAEPPSKETRRAP